METTDTQKNLHRYELLRAEGFIVPFLNDLAAYHQTNDPVEKSELVFRIKKHLPMAMHVALTYAEPGAVLDTVLKDVRCDRNIAESALLQLPYTHPKEFERCIAQLLDASDIRPAKKGEDPREPLNEKFHAAFNRSPDEESISLRDAYEQLAAGTLASRDQYLRSVDGDGWCKNVVLTVTVSLLSCAFYSFLLSGLINQKAPSKPDTDALAQDDTPKPISPIRAREVGDEKPAPPQDHEHELRRLLEYGAKSRGSKFPHTYGEETDRPPRSR